MHKALLGDMEILSNHCAVTSQCLRLCKQNLQQLFIQVVVIGVVGGLNIGALNGEGR